MVSALTFCPEPIRQLPSRPTAAAFIQLVSAHPDCVLHRCFIGKLTLAYMAVIVRFAIG
jgi:hypothetical protein